MNLKYFIDLIENQGKNSIYSYLISEDLATDLRCTKESIANYMTKFEVTVDLTEEGIDQYDRVIEAIFHFITCLKFTDEQHRFCNEINQIGRIKYDFPDKMESLRKCIKLAGKLWKMPEEDIPQIIKHSYYRMKFDPKLITRISDALTRTDRINIYLHSKYFEYECTKEEPDMGTMYSL